MSWGLSMSFLIFLFQIAQHDPIRSEAHRANCAKVKWLLSSPAAEVHAWTAGPVCRFLELYIYKEKKLTPLTCVLVLTSQQNLWRQHNHWHGACASSQASPGDPPRVFPCHFKTCESQTYRLKHGALLQCWLKWAVASGTPVLCAKDLRREGAKMVPRILQITWKTGYTMYTSWLQSWAASCICLVFNKHTHTHKAGVPSEILRKRFQQHQENEQFKLCKSASKWTHQMLNGRSLLKLFHGDVAGFIWITIVE